MSNSKNVNVAEKNVNATENKDASWSLKEMYEIVNKLELKPNQIVNLGIGLPTGLADFTDETIFLQSENGLLGIGHFPAAENEDADIVNAGKRPVSILNGGCFFDSSESFSMIRSGKIDITILGGMEVSQFGDLANWTIPGSTIKGMGGAMDLVVGSKRVVVFMRHFNKQGQSKLTKECHFPLTGKKVVNRLITEYGIFDFDFEGNVSLKYKPKSLELEKIISAVPFDLNTSEVVNL